MRRGSTESLTRMKLIDELKRRNVLRAAIAYLASAWFLIEIANTILPRLGDRFLSRPGARLGFRMDA